MVAASSTDPPLDPRTVRARFDAARAACTPYLDGRVPGTVSHASVLGEIIRALFAGEQYAAAERALVQLREERHDLGHLSPETQDLLRELRAAGSLELPDPTHGSTAARATSAESLRLVTFAEARDGRLWITRRGSRAATLLPGVPLGRQPLDPGVVYDAAKIGAPDLAAGQWRTDHGGRGDVYRVDEIAGDSVRLTGAVGVPPRVVHHRLLATTAQRWPLATAEQQAAAKIALVQARELEAALEAARTDKIDRITKLRELTGLGLSEAKALVEACAPSEILGLLEKHDNPHAARDLRRLANGPVPALSGSEARDFRVFALLGLAEGTLGACTITDRGRAALAGAP